MMVLCACLVTKREFGNERERFVNGLTREVVERMIADSEGEGKR